MCVCHNVIKGLTVTVTVIVYTCIFTPKQKDIDTQFYACTMTILTKLPFMALVSLFSIVLYVKFSASIRPTEQNTIKC